MVDKCVPGKKCRSRANLSYTHMYHTCAVSSLAQLDVEKNIMGDKRFVTVFLNESRNIPCSYYKRSQNRNDMFVLKEVDKCVLSEDNVYKEHLSYIYDTYTCILTNWKIIRC